VAARMAGTQPSGNAGSGRPNPGIVVADAEKDEDEPYDGPGSSPPPEESALAFYDGPQGHAENDGEPQVGDV